MVEPPETPPDSPLTLEDVMRSRVHRDLSTPKLRVGDEAIPFTLPRLAGGPGGATGPPVSLGAYRGRLPVALIFGSYT